MDRETETADPRVASGSRAHPIVAASGTRPLNLKPSKVAIRLVRKGGVQEAGHRMRKPTALRDAVRTRRRFGLGPINMYFYTVL